MVMVAMLMMMCCRDGTGFDGDDVGVMTSTVCIV